MVKRFLFVGERRSQKAVAMGVTWKDGRLAAKQLFDALRTIGVEVDRCRFDNIFKEAPTGPEAVCGKAIRRIYNAVKTGMVIIGMGRKVQAELSRRDIKHLAITHPAARGAIRGKAAYASHLRSVIQQEGGRP